MPAQQWWTLEPRCLLASPPRAAGDRAGASAQGGGRSWRVKRGIGRRGTTPVPLARRRAPLGAGRSHRAGCLRPKSVRPLLACLRVRALPLLGRASRGIGRRGTTPVPLARRRAPLGAGRPYRAGCLRPKSVRPLLACLRVRALPLLGRAKCGVGRLGRRVLPLYGLLACEGPTRPHFSYGPTVDIRPVVASRCPRSSGGRLRCAACLPPRACFAAAWTGEMRGRAPGRPRRGPPVAVAGSGSFDLRAPLAHYRGS
jgi:hypothetical protein